MGFHLANADQVMHEFQERGKFEPLEDALNLSVALGVAIHACEISYRALVKNAVENEHTTRV